MQKINPGKFIKISKINHDYIYQCGCIKTDREIAEYIDMTVDQVAYYRRYVLKIDARRTQDKFDNLDDIKQELETLVKFHATYSGCMIESLEYRIKELSRKVAL